MSDERTNVDKSTTLSSRYGNFTDAEATTIECNTVDVSGFALFTGGLSFLARGISVVDYTMPAADLTADVWTNLTSALGFVFTEQDSFNIDVNADNIVLEEAGLYVIGSGATMGVATAAGAVDLGLSFNGADPTVIMAQVGLTLSALLQPIGGFSFFTLNAGDVLRISIRPNVLPLDDLTMTGNILIIRFGS